MPLQRSRGPRVFTSHDEFALNVTASSPPPPDRNRRPAPAVAVRRTPRRPNRFRAHPLSECAILIGERAQFFLVLTEVVRVPTSAWPATTWASDSWVVTVSRCTWRTSGADRWCMCMPCGGVVHRDASSAPRSSRRLIDTPGVRQRESRPRARGRLLGNCATERETGLEPAISSLEGTKPNACFSALRLKLGMVP